MDIHRSYEQTIDTVSADSLIEAGFSDDQARGNRAVLPGVHRGAPGRNHGIAGALRASLQATADLRRHKGPSRRPGIAAALVDDRTVVGGLPAVGQVEGARLRPSGTLADIVSVVRYAIGGADELAPFADGVRERFSGWLAMQETAGHAFTVKSRCVG